MISGAGALLVPEIFFIKKNLFNGSFLVLNITFSYFVYCRYGNAHLWQYFSPEIFSSPRACYTSKAIVCIADCVIFVMLTGAV
ncbi:hypothetical protein B4923_00490 [Brenneria roseae subsp. americana]|uniref:Uncharacterized protein n=1 Tax=Brenneria roseae subsp. americana TaxID=1508507 RepID=A0A2U1U1Z5_9GAMM|nr:hypothetical protein B4923_00490 [Brenneria roseae subsp. americana]